jgi:hypothetical protein
LKFIDYTGFKGGKIMQQYGFFVALGIGTVLCGWLLVAYAVALWFSRRLSHLQQIIVWIVALQYLLEFPNGLERSLPAPFFVYYYGFMLILIRMLWRRWRGAVTEPGYTSARELLLLRRPQSNSPSGNAGAGWFVPPNVTPDTSPRFSWRALLTVIGIFGVIAVIMGCVASLVVKFID